MSHLLSPPLYRHPQGLRTILARAARRPVTMVAGLRAALARIVLKPWGWRYSGGERRWLMADVVLVTGVSRYLGGRFARLLTARPGVKRVIGVDVIPPLDDIGSAEFVRADIRNPMIAKIITQAEVDTVVHMNLIATPLSVGGRGSQKEINVIGTMQLLAACQKAPSIRRLVVKSSAAVYGSSPRDPAMFTEDMGPRSLPRIGFGKDSVEVEGYVRGFSRRRADVEISMLRLANIVGPGIRTSLTDYFR